MPGWSMVAASIRRASSSWPRPQLPAHLHWFKWEAYATWLSGISLLVIVYWAQAGIFLAEPGGLLAPWQAVAASAGVLLGSWVVYELLCSFFERDAVTLAIVGVVLATGLAFGLTHLFPGRAALLHVGASLGSIMAANVFAVIIPNQRKAVEALIRGEVPDPKYGKLGKQRSVHNTYLTLPVLFLMISNHFPMVYQHRWNWLIVLALAIVGGLVRHIFVLRHTHRDSAWMLPAAAAIGVVIAIGATPCVGTVVARKRRPWPYPRRHPGPTTARVRRRRSPKCRRSSTRAASFAMRQSRKWRASTRRRRASASMTPRRSSNGRPPSSNRRWWLRRCRSAM